MAKDFTKYQIEGIAENLNKARLVQKVITHYCENENPDFEDLKLTWFDDLQGGKGVVKLLSEVDEKNTRNYYVDAPIQLKDGSIVVVCNQWGKDNLANFVYMAGFHGYKITTEVEGDGSIHQSNDELPKYLELDDRLSSLLEEVINEQDSFMQAFSIEHFDKSGIDKHSYEKFAFEVLKHTSNCWIAGILAMNLFELGNFPAALKIVEDSDGFDIQDEEEFQKFESVKKEIQAIESSKFKFLRKSADEVFEVRFNFWGAFCNVYLCAKESGEDIDDIDSHYEKAVDSYFSFDNDVMISIEINGNEIFQGEIKQLQIDNNSITEIESYDEIIHQLAWQRLVKFRNHKSIDDRFEELSKYVSTKNGVITLADNINENRKEDCAPDFDNRYSMVEYGKWFLKTYPIKIKSFDITDFAFIKSRDLEDMMPSAEGSEYCFSKILHNEKGELEFEVDSNSVKSQDFCQGWPSDY